MKLLVRILGITVMGLIVSIGIIYFANTNIIINELNECSSLAMKQTQSAVLSSIKDQLDLIDNDDFNNEEYKNYYHQCFNSTVKDYSIYNIDIESDVKKGIMYVEINVPSYKLIPTKKLLNIIDIKGEGLNDLESLQYDITSTSKVNKGTNGIKGTKAGTLKTLPATPDGKIRGYTYDLTVYATEARSPTTSNSVGPYIEIRCTDENNEVKVIDAQEGGDKAFTILQSTEKCYCKLFEVVMPNDLDTSKYSVSMNSVATPRTSTITEYNESKTKIVDLHLSDEVAIDDRYIDSLDTLSESSIWLQNASYKKELESYLRYLE